MKMRLTFSCWNCDREYSLTREIGGKPKLIVACPYCEKEAVADLNPIPDSTTSIYKSLNPPETTIETYKFPIVIPTSAPTDLQ